MPDRDGLLEGTERRMAQVVGRGYRRQRGKKEEVEGWMGWRGREKRSAEASRHVEVTWEGHCDGD